MGRGRCVERKGRIKTFGCPAGCTATERHTAHVSWPADPSTDVSRLVAAGHDPMSAPNEATAPAAVPKRYRLPFKRMSKQPGRPKGRSRGRHYLGLTNELHIGRQKIKSPMRWKSRQGRVITVEEARWAGNPARSWSKEIAFRPAALPVAVFFVTIRSDDEARKKKKKKKKRDAFITDQREEIVPRNDGSASDSSRRSARAAKPFPDYAEDIEGEALATPLVVQPRVAQRPVGVGFKARAFGAAAQGDARNIAVSDCAKL